MIFVFGPFRWMRIGTIFELMYLCARVANPRRYLAVAPASTSIVVPVM